MGYFRVIKPGAISLLQDEGRFGFQHWGITTGGAMDEHASRWANRLLGNASNDVVLEITLGNVHLEATEDTWIALTGAELNCKINGVSRDNWQTHFVSKGDQLTMGWAQAGVSSYLAVAGGFQLGKEFGSCSTVKREGLGGLNGGVLQAGDQLVFNSVGKYHYTCPHQVPPDFVPDYTTVLNVRVIAGYQAAQFRADSLSSFYSSTYIVKPDSDRMGFRLEGEMIESGVTGLLSEGISYGAIQVPADGQPIILLKDRQTLGGYPKLGSVLPIDGFSLSQRKAGDSVCFSEISLTDAQQLMHKFYTFFSA